MIAGLPQAPSQYNPLLQSTGGADAPQRRAAGHEAAGLHHREPVHERGADRARRCIRPSVHPDPPAVHLRPTSAGAHPGRYGLNTVRTGGLKVYTTIKPRLQKAAQSAVDACAVCYPNGGPASALASVDPKTGEIVALASSQHYSGDSQFNFAAQAHRQPGSSFKPFVLTRRDQAGRRPELDVLRRQLAEDADAPGRRRPGRSTTPSRAAGRCRSTDATVDSVNAVFAQLVLDVGVQQFADTAYSMGITSPLGVKRHGPSPASTARTATSRRRPRSAGSARASRRSRWPAPTPRSPTAASATPRPRSPRSSSLTATSTGRPRRRATACSPTARPMRSRRSSRA